MCAQKSQLKNKSNKNFQNQFDVFVLNLKMITFSRSPSLFLIRPRCTLNNMHILRSEHEDFIEF